MKTKKKYKFLSFDDELKKGDEWFDKYQGEFQKIPNHWLRAPEADRNNLVKEVFGTLDSYLEDYKPRREIESKLRLG